MAQSIFTQLNPQNFSFTSPQLTKWNAATAKSEHEQTYLVQFGDLAASVSSKGTLSVDVPDDDHGTLTFYPRLAEFYSESDYVWVGDIQESGIDGYILLVSKDGNRTGEINIDDFVYQFQSLSSTSSILVKYKESFLEAAGSDVLVDVSPENSNETPPVAESSAPCNIVRVCFIATAGVSQNPNDIADMGIAQLHGAMSTGGGGSPQLKFEKAGVTTMSALTESNNIFADLKTFPTLPAAQAFQTSSHADIMVFLTDGNYSNSGGNIFGATPATNTLMGPQAMFAFCIVEADEAISHKTFCHEIGHVMGGDHSCATTNLLPCTGSPVFTQHGFVFNIANGGGWPGTKERHTIMVTNSDKNKRILWFSNPNRLYQAQYHMGNGTANMETFLYSVACTVSEFSANSELVVKIIAPDEVEVGSAPFTATSDVSSGIAPYAFQWSQSYNGTYYTNVGTSSSASITPPPNLAQGNKVYVRLKVTDAVGKIVYALKKVTVLPALQGGGGNARMAGPKNLQASIYPNPASKQVTIKFVPEDAESPIQVSLFDQLGRLCYTDRYFFSGGPETISLPTELPEGAYTLKCLSGDQQLIFPLSISGK